MGSEPKSTLSIGFTSSFFLLLLPLLYIAVFRSDNFAFVSWKNQISNWSSGSNGSNTTSINRVVEEKDSADFLVRRLVRGKDRADLDATGFACDSTVQYDICISKDPIRIDTRSMTVYLSRNDTLPPIRKTIRPYARKEADAKNDVSPIEFLRSSDINPPSCDVTHNVSAVIFSTGGFAGNIFHEFNEIIIPLFLTCHHFQTNLQFIITDFRPLVVRKYHRILTHLSQYDVINSGADGRVHCFPGAVIGLRVHDNLFCNTTDIPGGYSTMDFKNFLRDSFSLKVKKVSEVKGEPVLVLISRQASRVFLNEYEMAKLARELGFQVVAASPIRMSNQEKIAGVINSASVLVGAHGAGLTNAVFLAEGAVVVQVVPLGLDWASSAYFADPIGKMDVHYLEYKISPEESSLLEKYGRDHPAITNPESIHAQGYPAARAMYVDGQNLNINLLRFRETLVEAMRLLGGSDPIE